MAWKVTDIGLLSSIAAAGPVILMLAGLPLVLRAGPVRSLQVGLRVGAVVTLLYALPLSPGMLMGSLLIGLASGPQAAAGSHNLIFSIKQAGVPIAGVLAGRLGATAVLKAAPVSPRR